MLQNAPYFIRFLITLILAAVIALLLRLVWKKLRPKLYPFRSATVVAWMISGALLLTWLASMLGITWQVSRNYVEYYRTLGATYCGAMVQHFDLPESDKPGSAENELWRALRFGNGRAYKTRVVDGDAWFSSLPKSDWQTAAAIYDSSGTLFGYSSDYFYFPYDTEEAWDAQGVDSPSNTCGYTKVDVDIGSFQDSVLADYTDDYTTAGLSIYARTMRFTGTFDETQFHADRIEYILDSQFRAALESREPDKHYFDSDGSEVVEYNYSYSEVIKTENIPWHTLYDSGNCAENAVTIYTTMHELSNYDEGKSLTFSDQEYDNLLSLLLSYGTAENINQYSTDSILDMIVFSQGHVYQENRTIYTVVTANRYSPLLSAMSELKGLYTVTFLLTVALALTLYFTLRKKLISPIDAVNDAIETQWSDIYRPEDYLPGWREPTELVNNYSLTQDKMRMRENEINRLNTALEYAKDAEENRRQMVSNIAHEFKTPLAVIHSYAEGLNEHIAEGKREKYLNVILSEADHLDNMVLELLDLSRLEAGKVKLARDEFDLTRLARSVFERLDMAAQAKELNVEFHFPDHCPVVADEARIRQVIENFASNAVKYTPAGGNIRVTITKQEFRTRPASTTFAIENDSPLLSEDALSKVWDTFYRTDDSRSGGGTGLGLAIAKNIVELHGGKCAAENTTNGVKFQFTI